MQRPLQLKSKDGACFEQDILEALGHAVIVTDVDGIITYMNPAAENLYGYSTGEAVGKPGADLMVASEGGEEGHMLRLSVASGEKSTARIRLRRKDGSEFLGRIQASPIHNETGEVTALVGLTWDVTEEVRAREDLFAELEATKALIDAIPDSIFHLGRDGTYRFVRTVYPELLVQPEAELLGRRIPEVMRSETADLWMRTIERAIDENTRPRIEYVATTVTGEERTFEAHLAPLNGDSVVAVARDITELKRIQRSLEAERNQFTEVLSKAPVLMAVLRGPSHLFEFANEHYYGLVGQRELIGRTVVDALPEIEGQGFLPLLDRVYETGESFFGKEIPAMVQTDPDLPREEHILNLNYIPLRNIDGNITGILAHGVDVTAEVKARRRLEIHNDVIRAIQNAQSSRSTSLVTLQHLQASIPSDYSAVLTFPKDVNDVKSLAELPGPKANGFSLDLIKHREDLPDLESVHAGKIRHFKNLTQLEASTRLTERLVECGHRALLMLPLHDGRECTGVMLFSADMPFREEHVLLAEKAAESLAVALHGARMLEELNGAKMRLEDLNRRLINAHESERRSLALELHDQVGQILTSISFALYNFDDSDVPPNVLDSIERSRNLLGDLANQIRSLSLDLRPPMLDDFGLKSTLEWYIPKFEQDTGIEIQWKLAGLADDLLPEAVRTAAFRIVQESLTNVARHARVDQAVVGVLKRENMLHIRISDEGAGFDVDAILHSSSTSGLTGITERVRLLDGEVDIESSSQGGTSIIVSLPVAS